MGDGAVLGWLDRPGSTRIDITLKPLRRCSTTNAVSRMPHGGCSSGGNGWSARSQDGDADIAMNSRDMASNAPSEQINAANRGRRADPAGRVQVADVGLVQFTPERRAECSLTSSREASPKAAAIVRNCLVISCTSGDSSTAFVWAGSRRRHLISDQMLIRKSTVGWVRCGSRRARTATMTSAALDRRVKHIRFSNCHVSRHEKHGPWKQCRTIR